MIWRILPLASSLVIAVPATAQTPVTGPTLPADPETAATGAAAPPEIIDLQTVLRLAQTANPRIAADEQQIAGARADRITAGALPNPSVSYFGNYQPGRDTNFTGRQAHEARVELPLLLGGQRRARIFGADRRIDAARSHVAVTRLEIATDAGVAFVALLAAQETIGLRRRAVAELDRLRTIVAGRRSSGEASDYDLVRVDVEVESTRAELAGAEADLISAQADLSNALGISGWHPEASGQLDGLVQRPIEGRRAVDELPSVAAAIADERVARADVVTARRERFPKVSVNGGRFWTPVPYGQTFYAGVSLEVPLFDRRIGPVRKAEADARAAEFRTQVAKARAMSEIDRYAAQVDTRSNALAIFNRRIGAKLPSLGRMAEDAYRLRGGSVIELIDATRSRFDNEVVRIDLSSKLAEAMLRLELAQGNAPDSRP